MPEVTLAIRQSQTLSSASVLQYKCSCLLNTNFNFGADLKLVASIGFVFQCFFHFYKRKRESRCSSNTHYVLGTYLLLVFFVLECNMRAFCPFLFVLFTHDAKHLPWCLAHPGWSVSICRMSEWGGGYFTCFIATEQWITCL